VSTHSNTAEAVGRLIEQGSEADELLRGVVAILHERYPWVGISFVEEGDLVLGPSEGERAEEPVRIPISYDGKVVAELAVAGGVQDRTSLEQVAELIAPYCLVGWDTGGEAWSP
jgi:putative methionine-R-sulfoxide reductase with GAF domain